MAAQVFQLLLQLLNAIGRGSRLFFGGFRSIYRVLMLGVKVIELGGLLSELSFECFNARVSCVELFARTGSLQLQLLLSVSEAGIADFCKRQNIPS